jgi:hypothetical protein
MPGAPRNSGASGNKGAGGTLHRGHGRGRRPERAPSYGTGCEEAQAFWGRAHIEACRRGRGTAAVRTVVALGDGAEWIWRHARAYLGLPDVEMVEIIDLYHAYEYLWAVGNAVFGEGTAAAAWVEPLKTRLYTEGAAPLHAALTTLARTVCIPTADTTAESVAATAVRRALEYVTTNAPRLDYPAFMARRFPIGSGAVESSCKVVVQARTKGAGMRWSGVGAQRVATLRALHRSGRWDAFWQSQPQRARLHLVPRARRVPAVLPTPDTTSTCAAPTRPTPPPAPSDVSSADVPPVPRLLRPAADHPWRRQSLGRARSA